MTNNNYEDDIFSDEIVDLDKDAFNFDAEAEKLAQQLKRGKAPFVVAICGEWGAGKSSFLRFLYQKLKGKDNIVIYFNSWRASLHEIPEISFIYELTTQLERSNIFRIKSKKMKQVFNALVSSSIDVFSENSKILGSFYKTYKKTKEKLKNEIEEALKSECELLISFEKLCSLIPEGKNIYVFIDELDRCSPEKIVKIIESLKKYFYGKDILYEDIVEKQGLEKREAIKKHDSKSVPFKYILAIDEEYVSKAFATHYKLSESVAIEYLSKFIQFRYYIKDYDWSKLTKNVISHLNVDMDFWDEQNILDINYILIKAFRVYNPRTVKKILVRIINHQKKIQKTYKERRDYLEKIFQITEKETQQDNFIYKESILRATNIFWLIDSCIKEVFPSEIKWYLDNHVFEKLPMLNTTIDSAQQSVKNNWPRYFFISNYSIPTFELSLKNGEMRSGLDSMAFSINESIQHAKAICSGLKINNLSFPNDIIIKLLVHLIKNEWDQINKSLFKR